MLEHNAAGLRIIFTVVAMVLFAIAGFTWVAPFEPWRDKLIAMGLFFWVLSTFFS